MADQQSCSRCPVLEAEIARLRAENARLRAYINYLLHLIDRAQRFMTGIIQEATQIMSQHQPLGTWSLWRGRKEIAEKVSGILKG